MMVGMFQVLSDSERIPSIYGEYYMFHFVFGAGVALLVVCPGQRGQPVFKSLRVTFCVMILTFWSRVPLWIQIGMLNS